jgi:hypothetical protein
MKRACGSRAFLLLVMIAIVLVFLGPSSSSP